MWKPLKLFLLFLPVFVYSGSVQARGKFSNSSDKIYFIENKGQVKDQNGNSRNDIQYAVQASGLTIFIGNGKLHYQFTKSDVNNKNALSAKRNKYDNIDLLLQTSKIADLPTCNMATYRMDAALIGVNENALVIAEEPLDYYENYYTPGCPQSGIRAHTYKKITYKNIYPGIDWIIYIKGDHLEYEFVVGPKGDAAEIKLEYNGQTSLKINEDGSITATTPMGVIKEQAPICYSSNRSNTLHTAHNKIASAYKISGNILSYRTEKNSAIIIDPTLEWGTYYGNVTGYSPLFSMVTDALANVYASGFSWSNTAGLIATTGSFQDTIGGQADAFLVKFDSSGNRLWATYYGGSGTDYGFAVTCDVSGNVYMGGATFSHNNITTPGAQEPAWIWVTQNVGFLAKFDSSGSRQWATYVGGSNGTTFDLEIYSVCCDIFGNVYASGATDDTSNVGTPGTFKPYKHEGAADTSIDCFLIQYNATTGLQNWGTYYGNLHTNFNGTSYADGENVYLTGYTNCRIDSDITTPSSYQPTFGGGSTDAFLVQFNSSGQRIWATYYGGTGDENTGGVGCDHNGNIYMHGVTTSDSNIASPGCFQPMNAGAYDDFLVAFTPSGSRIWATYYGGPGTESCNSGGLIVAGNYIYITGGTTSDTGIVSSCAWQPVYGGGSEDAFLAQFNDSDGYLNWATFYGGNGMDEGRCCAFDGKCVYLCGKTVSTNNIATPGSFDPTGGGGGAYYQGFLAKFDFTYHLQAISGLTGVCAGDTISLSDTTLGGTWSSSSATATIGSSSGILIGIDSGTTIITYTTPNGCFVTISDTVNNCPPLKTPLIIDNSIDIYPNPAFDELTIKTSQPLNLPFVINNNLGQAVIYGNITDSLTYIKLTSLPAGIYFIKLNSDKGAIVKQFMKD